MGRELHVHSHPSRVEHWRHLIEIVALAGAAAWALYVFVYQERIKPTSEPPELQPAFSVEHTPMRGDKEFVKIDTADKNAGESTIYFAGMIENVYGIRFANKATDYDEPPRNGNAEFNRTLLPTGSSLLYSVAASFRPFGDAHDFIELQPVTYAGTFGFAIPAHTFDAIELQWTICFTKLANRTWRVPLHRRADRSYAFDLSHFAPGLLCYNRIRPGDYYPL